MSNFWAVYKREMRCYFTSPIAYILLAAFSFIIGWFFSNIITYYNLISLQSMRSPYFGGGLYLTQGVMRPLFHNMSVLLLILLPFVTMRLFAEEKRSGTIELLLTYPVRDVEAVMGKFASALTVFACFLGVSLLCPLLVGAMADPELGPIVGAYLGFVLLGAAFISLGILVSSLTENQIIAGVATLGASLFLFLVGWASGLSSGVLGKLASELSLLERMSSFEKGVIDTADIIYYICFSVFFLFLTLRSLEARKWRG